MKVDTVLILDFGGQYCHLIGREIRELEVYSEVVPFNLTPEEIKALKNKFNVKGIILSGGPLSVYGENAPRCDQRILDMGIPILGICYGHQLIAYIFGGKVQSGTKKEYGVTYAAISKQVGVLKGLSNKEKVWMSHGDTVFDLPSEYETLAYTENCPVAAFRHTEKLLYGLQWHPEVVHTENGRLMLKNFVFEVCRCKPSWLMEKFVQKAVDEIKQIMKGDKCIIALSGGVDSGTVAVLAAKAIGRNLTAVFVDHGFMRIDEPEFVERAFKKFGMSFVHVRARERFSEKLKGVTDPEQKRRIIGTEFVRVFEEVAREVDADYLIQGTIYPDRIESGFKKHTEKIKTHHNVAGLPSKVRFKKIVEPLADLYKDEVRKVAETLGLPEEVVWRQPFPGPGLAVRIVGEVTQDKIDILSKADKIVTDEIEKNRLKERLWQYFSVLTDTKSTGVRGDSRAYGYVVAIRAVESREAMTASFANIPYQILERISMRITNEIPQVVRVVYDVTHKPPSTIEWE